LATGRGVLLLQEGEAAQPIDYRQLVKTYRHPDEIPRLVEPLFLQTIAQLQEAAPVTSKVPSGILEKIDLGDLAAENEIRELRS